MICCKKSDKLEEEEDDVYNVSKIYFDDLGNLIYDQSLKPFDRKSELETILQLDPGDPKVYCIVTIQIK